MKTAAGHHAAESVGVANLFIAKALRAPLWLLLSAMLARVLEPQGLGTWSMILAAAMFLNQLLLHWTQSITQRFGRGEWLATQRFDGTFATRWPLLGVGLGIALAALLLTPFDWPARFYGLTGGAHLYVLPALFAFWLMAETQSLQQVRERYTLLAWTPVLSDLLLLLVVGVVALAIAGGHAERGTAFTVFLGAMLLGWCVWLALELRGLPLRVALPQRAELDRAMMFSAPLIPGFLVGYASEWGDYFLIQHFFGSTAVGLFHPACQYLLLMVGLPTALASVLLPRIIAAHEEDGGAAVRQLISRHAPQFTLLWGAAALLAVAILPWIFSWLLGERYAASVPVLQVLLIAVPGAVVQHVYHVACFAQGRLAIATLGFFGMKSAVNLAISFVLLPKLGIVGSAVGAAASYLLLQWLFVLDQHRHLGLPGGRGVQTLAAVHVAAVLLALIDHPLLRLAAAALAASALLLWARQAALFSPEEVSAIIPARLRRLDAPLRRLLCRNT